MRTKAIFLILTAAFLLALATPAFEALAAGERSGDSGGEFVRLRGSIEIHTLDCPKVKRAAPGGVVKAERDDGPGCFICLRKKAKQKP